jgi:glycosyltransferase involved in cell wall biosynthesis
VLEVSKRLTPRHRVRLLLGGFSPSATYPELAHFSHVRLSRLDWLTARLPAHEVLIANSFGSNLLALRNGPRVGYWVHSVRSVFLARDNRLDLRLRRLLDWLAVRRSGELIANSQYTAGRLRALYGREADAVVYPGVDLELFQPGEHDAGFALTVGRLAPEKGLDRLLEVWRGLPDVPLQVIGGGDTRLLSQAPPNVVRRGPLAPREVAELYRQASLAVFAPRAEEFGIAPLEAMASGLPVVAWREGGLLETVVDQQTGFLVDETSSFRHRVRQLSHDRELRTRLGQNGRQRAEAFSWERTAAEIEGACQRLARRTARPARAPQP